MRKYRTPAPLFSGIQEHFLCCGIWLSGLRGLSGGIRDTWGRGYLATEPLFSALLVTEVVITICPH